MSNSVEAPRRTGPDLPPVERIVEGLWSVPVPLWNSPLGYVLVYVFETEKSGVVLVDAGWDAPGSFQALVDGLQQLGAGMADVEGVIVTHVHPDHYGLAGRIIRESGAWFGMHPADAAEIHRQYEQPDELLGQTAAWLERAGTPTLEQANLRDASLSLLNVVHIAHPDVELHHLQRAPIPGWDLQMLHTPGHTPGHLSAYEPNANVLLTGDHVLPRISPNISAYRSSGHNPLKDYLTSLKSLQRYAGALVLPAHEWRFDRLAERVIALLEHHELRLDEIENAIADGRRTAWDVARVLTWSRNWDEPAFLRRAALGETYAHLLLLESRGRATRSGGIPELWEPTP